MFQILSIIILFVISVSLVANYMACKVFFEYWQTDERAHWQTWGKPEFIEFYQNQLGEFRPIAVGSECDRLENLVLSNKVKNLKLTWLIVVAMIFSGCALVGFEADLRPAQSAIIPLENINL
ncbi:hypothetical protein [Photobacterium sanguinicancri]|uniref:hypothetical protein n=1 Tax=Photobacterium sanguinicancri TaxID=875932 RepID=UPI0007868C6A|nr:hypothetical protein [Photobacterium sanguinicancri]KXI21319.1 hypothetical protein AS132_22185 [Photobacterium sanguinicancri]